MYFKKRYGQSRIDSCPFCGKTATTESKEGVPVCLSHKGASLPAMKCMCDSYLELRKGKFGAFFSCMKCGNVNFQRALELNPGIEDASVKEDMRRKAGDKEERKEITVRSDELDFLY